MTKSIPLVGIRAVHENRIKYEHIGNVTAADQIVQLLITMDVHNCTTEHFYVFYMNVKGKLTGVELVAIGTQSSALIHPREVFKGALLNNADRIIIAHNHPSGDPTPSTADYAITDTLKQAGALLQVKLVDHIVIGSGDTPKHFSMNANGHL